MTGAILVGFTLVAFGAMGGFLIALGARHLARPTVVRSPKLAARAGKVVVDPSEESAPSLAQYRQPPRQVHDLVESLTPMPIPTYDPDAENEDDVPTTLYRADDDQVEDMLAELDTGYERR